MMASSVATQQQSLAPTPAARAFLSRLSDGMKMAVAQRRPWKELVDRNSLAKPESLSDALGRIRKNIGYFKINYILVVLGCIAASLVYHPLSL
ncbi:PRA1 family protein B1-like, partial [Selaginella moellendorffii]